MKKPTEPCLVYIVKINDQIVCACTTSEKADQAVLVAKAAIRLEAQHMYPNYETSRMEKWKFDAHIMGRYVRWESTVLK